MTTVLDRQRQKVTVVMRKDGAVTVNDQTIGRWRREGVFLPPRWELITLDSRRWFSTTRGLRHAAVLYYQEKNR